MNKNDTFSQYHPLVNFVYFTAVIAFSMIFMNPLCLCISLICSCVYSIYLNGRKSIKFNIKYMLPLVIITSVINPAFNHEGMTVITYLYNGNPLTLESIIYGICAAVMLISVISWFSCYNCIMTSDKFVYLFGRIIPSLSLIFSMTLRFVPRFKAQIKVVSDAQKCIGHDISYGGIFQRLRHGITVISIMITWSLENAVETADSMRSRGYGLKGRTAFSIYRLEKRDIYVLAFMLICTAYIIIGYIWGGIYWRYFPSIKYTINVYTVTILIVYVILLCVPMIINIREALRWKQLLNSEM